MKTNYIIRLMMVVIVLSSCSTTEKFYVSGTPNTQIYTPNYGLIGTVGIDGKAKIEFSSSNYYAFLLSKSPNSDYYIPFALDYKKKGRRGTKIAEYIGIGTAIFGTCIAVPCALVGEYSAGLIGCGMAVAGGSIALSAGVRSGQTSYEYQYQYLNNQQTNQDLQFAKAVFKEPYKGSSSQVIKTSTSKTVKEEDVSVSKKRLSDKSSKILKDYGKQIEGVYIGDGTLTQKKETIEIYNGIKIKIERISKNEVNVNVEESDGTEFFEAPSKYKIIRNKNGSYTLKHSNISTAIITIDKNGNLTYLHPKVNIEEELYVLKILVK